MYQIQNQKQRYNNGLLSIAFILFCFLIFCIVPFHRWNYNRKSSPETAEIGVGTDVGSQVVIGTFATVDSVEDEMAAVRPTDVFTANFQRYGIGVSGDLFMLPLAAVTEVSTIPQLSLPSNEFSYGHPNTLREGDTVICIFSGSVIRREGSFVYVRPESTFRTNGGSSPIAVTGRVSEDNIRVYVDTLLRIDPNDPFPVPDPHRPWIQFRAFRERRPNPFLRSDAGPSQPSVGSMNFPLLPSSQEQTQPNVLPQDAGPSQPSFGGDLTSLRPPSSESQELPRVLSERERHQVRMMNLPRAPNPEIQSDWYYWEVIQRDPWFTTYRCEGPDECSGDHRCSEGYYMFHRRLVPKFRDSSIVETRIFRNEYTTDEPSVSGAFGPVNTAGIFLEYAYFLIRNPAIRLWSISVTPGHSFIIEQREAEFRLYQSWADSFDLRYWTDYYLGDGLLCEPSAEVREALRHPGGGNAEFLARAGVQDDTQSIIEARARYGCLTALGSGTIRRIFQSISEGFFLEYRLLTAPGDGMDAIFPAELSFTGSGDTRPFFGKHVIDLRKLFAMRRFEIEITFIQDNRKQDLDESFVNLLRDMRAATGSDFMGSSSNVDTNEVSVAQKGTCTMAECESCPITDEEIHRRRMSNAVLEMSLTGLRRKKLQVRANERFRTQQQVEEVDICSECCTELRTRLVGLSGF